MQELAFKVLRGWDVTYVDGFSGPWESKTDDFADTSFMIAIGVLMDAQDKIAAQTGLRRKVKCFFSEKDAKAYDQMVKAVAPFNLPDQSFEVRTFHGTRARTRSFRGHDAQAADQDRGNGNVR